MLRVLVWMALRKNRKGSFSFFFSSVCLSCQTLSETKRMSASLKKSATTTNGKRQKTNSKSGMQIRFRRMSDLMHILILSLILFPRTLLETSILFLMYCWKKGCATNYFLPSQFCCSQLLSSSSQSAGLCSRIDFLHDLRLSRTHLFLTHFKVSNCEIVQMF